MASAPEITSTNPATGEAIETFRLTTDDECERILVRTDRKAAAWRDSAIDERIAVLRAFASALRAQQERLARMATLEMGKPITAARAEIEKCAGLCDWFVERGAALLDDRPMGVPAGKAWLSYAPLGTVLGIMPWNFPYWQILRAAIPITFGGNAFLVKPAENTFGCAVLLNEIAQATGFERAFEAVNFQRQQCSDALADRRIAGLTLTGSVQAGKTLAAQAGAHIKKSLLELGGSDPFIVLADADIEKAAATAIASRFANCGQVCIAAKRIIVEESVLPRFTEAFLDRARRLTPADPLDDTTEIGPMARVDLRDALHHQVQATQAEGARTLLGGDPPARRGAWYVPTVLDGITPGMTAFKDELFGPVATLIGARDADHAVALANDSHYGLAASLWTEDQDRARLLSTRIDAGGVFINRMSASDPHVPIGGIKDSGYGRELTELGLREFMNIKTVWAA